MDDSSSIEALQVRLLDESDPGARASVHLELGRLALRDGRLEIAARHLREALLLNRSLDAAKDLLRELGEEAAAADRKAGLFRSLVTRFRQRGKAPSKP